MEHVAHAVRQCFHKILARTVDTDVVVLAVATVQQLGRIYLWITFRTRKNFHYIPAHEIWAHKIVGSSGVPRFHGMRHRFPVCPSWKEDCMESVGDTWWTHWILLWAAQCTRTILWRDRGFPRVLHHPSLWQYSNMYLHQWSQMSALPSTKAALQKHIRRAALQGGHH